MSIRQAHPNGAQSLCGRLSGKLAPLALAATALLAAGARADEPVKPMFSFSGFGTLGLVHSSEKNADFASSLYKPNGAGFTRSWSANVDSLVGAQVTADFTPQLSGVVQVIAEQNYDNSYRPHVEWANIRYQLTPDFSVRVGRTVLAAFLLSDTRKVAYAYPWVRPPAEVYRLLPVTASDGLDISYRLHIGESANTVRALVGRKDEKLRNNSGGSKARDAWAISNTTEYGSLTTRVAYETSRVTISPLNSLFDAFRQFGPQGVSIADKYDSDAKVFATLGIGAIYDPGNWFLMSEWAATDTHSVIGKTSGWYASGGYRFGKFTPYVTYARARADNLSDPGLNTATLPPFLAGPAAGLNGALNSILSGKMAQNTLSIGGRWDATRTTALKLQFDHTRIHAGSSSGLINIQPEFQTGGKVNVLSATVDFVF